MASRGTTKRKILDLAESLLQQRGYNAFSYHHLSSELGIKNAAIHYHFPSKEGLGIKIIERTHDRFKKWTSNPENRILSAKEQLDWFIKSYLMIMTMFMNLASISLLKRGSGRIARLGAWARLDMS